MSAERKLLASCLKDKDAFSACEKYALVDTFTEQGKIIYDGIKGYYGRDEHCSNVDHEVLAAQIGASLSNPKHRESFKELISSLADDEVSSANVMAMVRAQHRESVGGKLASALASGRGDEEVQTLIAEYTVWTGGANDAGAGSSSVYQAPLVSSLVEERKGNRIPIMPRALNEAIRGGALPGHHVVVFARPETGKTTFVLNAAAGFLKHGRSVLYIGNEDPAEDIICRLVGRMAGMRTDEVEANPDKADEVARKNGYEQFIYAGLAPGTLREIEQLVREYSPDVLIVDQVRNLSVGGSEGNYTVKLEQAASGIRAIAKRYGVVAISVTQAGDSASGKSILDMGDVDFSNTGIPATADLMIGIGASKDDVQAGRLVLSLCKNKIGGQHSVVPVIVDYSLGKLITQR